MWHIDTLERWAAISFGLLICGCSANANVPAPKHWGAKEVERQVPGGNLREHFYVKVAPDGYWILDGRYELVSTTDKVLLSGVYDMGERVGVWVETYPFDP